MEATASTDPAVAPLSPGDPRALGPYEVLGRLGSGGMGTVYLGRRPDGARVAIKVVRADLAADEGFLARFRWEVEAARRVAPFCTAPVLGADLDALPPYLVTEYVPGPRLDEAVRRDGPLPSSSLTGFAVGVAAALTAIHGVGLVHRDLKPSNVLLSAYGPRVIDFGIARALDAASTLTAHGAPVGTPGWMAPEQRSGGRVTAAADVFLWGALVAYAGSGRAPLRPAPGAGGLPAPPDLAALEPGLRRIVAAAMDPEPQRRPSAKGLLLALLGGSAPPDQHEAVTQVLERTWVREEPRADTRLATQPLNARAAPANATTRATPPPPAPAPQNAGWPAPTVPAARRRPRRLRVALIGAGVVLAILWALDRAADGETAAAPGVTPTADPGAPAAPAASAATAPAPADPRGDGALGAVRGRGGARPRHRASAGRRPFRVRRDGPGLRSGVARGGPRREAGAGPVLHAQPAGDQHRRRGPDPAQR